MRDELQEIEREYHENMGLSFDSTEWLIDQVKQYEADKKTMSQIVGEETLWQSGQYESEMSRLQKKVEQYEKALVFAKEYLEHSNIGQIQMVVSSINQALEEPTND
jgi:hypothetical protein